MALRIWESKGEAVYEGTLTPKDFLYNGWWFNQTQAFFQTDFVNRIDPNTFRWEWTGLPEKDLWAEEFLKLVWLCGILIDDKGFKYTLGCHFNPTWNNIVIHPGGTRQHAMMLFPPKEVKVLHFDTYGHQSKIRGKHLKKIDNYIEYCELNNYQIIFCPDHGTFIPHPMKGVNGIPNSKISQFKRVKFILDNLNLESNFKVPFLHLYSKKTNPNKCVVEYKIKNLEKISEYNINRILVLICLGKDYENEYFKITWKWENPL